MYDNKSRKLQDFITADSQIFGTIGLAPKETIGASVAVVSLAGIVGEKILQDGVANVLANKPAILADPNLLNLELAGGDFQKFKEHATTFDWKYGGEFELRQLCLNFLLDFLCDKKIWAVVKLLSQEVSKKDDLTLSGQELDNLFQSSGYAEYVRNNKEKLLKAFEPRSDQDSIESELKRMTSSDELDIFD